MFQKKSFSTTYLFWGWVLGSREPPEICLTALIYPNASLCLWKKLLDFFSPWKISIRKKHPILQTLRCPVFRNRTKGGFFLGIYGLLSLFSFLWTRSKWVRVVASAPKQCQRTGWLTTNNNSPKVCLTYRQTPKENGSIATLLRQKKVPQKAEVIWCRLRDVEGKLQALNFHPQKNLCKPGLMTGKKGSDRLSQKTGVRGFMAMIRLPEGFLYIFVGGSWQSWSWPPFLLYGLDFNGAMFLWV